MASIFDMDPDGLPKREKEKEDKPKRSKHREGMTPSETAAGKTRLASMVEKAFDALEEAVLHADHGNSIKAAQILLDRAGFGPRSTVDVNATHSDLTTLSREELAERAVKLSQKLRGTLPPAPIPIIGTGTVQ